MRNDLMLNRRTIVLAMGSALVLPNVAFALNDKEASDLIARLVDDINKVINSGKSESSMYGDFERIFAKYGDVPIIAQSALGVAWRSASSGQKSAYVSAFRGYMARKYGKRFRDFIGGKIVVTGTRQVSSGFLVSSTVQLSGSSPFSVEWQVSDKSGADKMFNMFIEGISLLATERTEISAMLDKRNGSLDQLIADLKTTQ